MPYMLRALALLLRLGPFILLSNAQDKPVFRDALEGSGIDYVNVNGEPVKRTIVSTPDLGSRCSTTTRTMTSISISRMARAPSNALTYIGRAVSFSLLLSLCEKK